jgi:tRNA pseudouridine55 synthase
MSRRRKGLPIDGVLLLDKPAGGSSNAVMQQVRRLIGAAKAGHTGTLDPLASGLLPVLFGEATKFSQILLDADKTYETVLQLGVTTSTGDAEGEVLETRPVEVDAAAIEAACAAFLGEIEQVPPMHSALKHEGRALYTYARAGVEIEREPRRITIHEIEVLAIEGARVSLRTRVSKGTYIRTLGEDIGRHLGCGAHLASLRRTAVGPLQIADSVSLEILQGYADEVARAALLLPADTLVQHLPVLTLAGEAAIRFSHGQAVAGTVEGECRVYAPDFLGLGRGAGGLVQPLRLVASRPAEA